MTFGVPISELPAGLPFTGSELIPFVQGGVTSQLPVNAIYPPFGQTAAELKANVTPVNGFYPECNVLRYGADNTGVTSSVAAIKAAVAVACYGGGPSGIGNHSRVYFPRGYYRFDMDSVLSNPTTIQRGIIFEGDGLMSSMLNLTTGGTTTMWYINGPAGEQQYISVTFRDLGFVGDNPSFANGFSLDQSQNMMFERCWFATLGTTYQCIGAAGGDALRFFDCRFNYIYANLLYVSNNQFLNCEIIGCTMELIYGNIINIGSGGGGAIRVRGGSIIMNDGGSPHSVINLAGGGLGNNNNMYLFDGVQIQLQTDLSTGLPGTPANCQLVTGGTVGGQSPLITFRDCNHITDNGARAIVVINQERVVFERCKLTQNQGDTYQITGPGAGGDQYGDPGSIIWQDSEVPLNLSQQVNLLDGGDGLIWPYASCRGGYWSDYQNSVSRTIRTAIDFDLNWQNQGRASNIPSLKLMVGKPANRQWCDATNNFNWIVTLPANAILVKVLVRREATASNVVYTLNVGTNSNATAYGTSGASNTNLAQNIFWDQTGTPANWVNVGTTSPGNTVEVSMTGSASGAGVVGSAGYFLIWYY
jgi:hypothetical protein